MLSLDAEETEIALLALRHTRARALMQCSDNASTAEQAVNAAWYCTQYCIAKMTALIERIEQAQADEAEEKNDAGS